MTFVAGFIFNETLGIIADSAETLIFPQRIEGAEGSNALKRFSSSFAEQVYIEDNMIVHEAAQKLYALNNQIIISFAGDTSKGTEGVEELKFKLLKAMGIRETIRSVFHTNKYDDTNEFVIGFFENNLPIIYLRRSGRDTYIETPKEKKTDEPFVAVDAIGTTSGGHLGACYGIIINAMANNLLAKEALVWMLAAMQAVSVNENSITTGVGGYFNGVLLNTNGIEWAPDTFYFLYSARAFNRGLRYGIHKFNRDNATFIFTNIKNVYASEFSELAKDELIHKWDKELVTAANDISEQYFICLSYDQRVGLIVDTKKIESPIQSDPQKKAVRFSEWAVKSMLSASPTEPRALVLWNNFFIENVLPVPPFHKDSPFQP